VNLKRAIYRKEEEEGKRAGKQKKPKKKTGERAFFGVIRTASAGGKRKNRVELPKGGGKRKVLGVFRGLKRTPMVSIYLSGRKIHLSS